MKKIINMIVKLLGVAKILSIPRKYVGKILTYYYRSKNRMLVFYNCDDPAGTQIFNLIKQIKKGTETPLGDLEACQIYTADCDDPAGTQIFNLIKQIKKETEMPLEDLEACQIYTAVRKTEKIMGDIAEVGVFRGGSAKLICNTTKKPVHLFDTFEGLPDLCKMDNPDQFHKGDFSASFETVKSYLKNYSNVYFYKGLFPSTAEPVKNKKFSFVHLDVDIYESTLDCLKFFYPRMSKGGVIISHDYPGSKGVKKAFDEFFSDKLEIIIEFPGCSQCLIIKV